MEHLFGYPKAKDLWIFDRNYPSYRFLATLTRQGVDFLGRCSRSSFKEARQMFGAPIESQIVTLRPHHTKKEEVRSLGLPSKIKVRFVKILLDTGEVEILVTSVLDQTFTIADFKELYHIRWGVETFYGIVKGRLDLENFTGKSVEIILQEFYSTIFLSSLESVLTEEAQTKLDQKTPHNTYPQILGRRWMIVPIRSTTVLLLLSSSFP